MATSNFTLTRNLKLRIDSNLTANAKSNLEKIDLLGSTFLVDSANTLRIRSSSDISIEPESPDLGGSALGGNLSIGNPSQYLSSIILNTSSLDLTAPLGLQDQAVLPAVARYLRLRYSSGLADTTSDRVLTVDPQGADRSLVLGGSYSQLGGSLSLTLTGDSTLTLPLTGTLATLAGFETLTHKTIDATANTIQNLANASIAVNAGISYSKLALAGSILDSDVANSAGIRYAKLNLTGLIALSDLSPSIAIPHQYLNLANSILLTDLSSGIQIPGSYIVPLFLTDVKTYGNLIIQDGVYSNTIAPPLATPPQTENLTLRLPYNAGNTGQVLSTDGFGNLAWTDKTNGGTSLTGAAAFWVTSDGMSKTFVHNLGTTDVDVLVNDVDLSERILIDTVSIVDLNTITVTSSEAPTGTWRILVQGQ